VQEADPTKTKGKNCDSDKSRVVYLSL